ncbi:MAG: HAMP domain-containing sensor histidine kinase, partial [Pseudomonadota bacterium]|nr:HAMP domain-containing sensor histidine kinase [Pseudomonadota bacterium]
MKPKKTASILKKFLLFNLTTFSILGLFTIFYLKAIQPNLVKNRAINHKIIITNTVDHLKRLNVEYSAEGIRTFLLSTRFLFQSLDRVQFFNAEGELIGDTNILDLDQNVFSRSDVIIEETIDGKSAPNELSSVKLNKTNTNKLNDILKKYEGEPLTISEINKNDFFVKTLSEVNLNEESAGYILVSEQANDIVNAVKERKDFIIRTVFAVTLVILIFSMFLNKYVLKPIGLLVKYSDSIKKKSSESVNIKRAFIRDDEIGKLTMSIDEMTKELQHRTNRAETFSNDLAHEIRNPLASLKSASELLDKTTGKDESEKLLKIINHDVERIERLITDYSQMLKDEASLSREKMSRIDLIEIINNVVEDFKQDLSNQNKKIEIKIREKISSKNGKYILGIENRLEQVIANLLDNSISF